MRFNEHHIDDLDYIKVLTNNTFAVAYLNDEKDKYIDLTSHTVVSNHLYRIYCVEHVQKICSLKKMVSMDDLWLLLLDSNGNIRENLILPHVEPIITSFNNMIDIDKGTRKKLKLVAIQVSKLCLINLNIQNKELEKLLTSYILIELIDNFSSDKISIINKIGGCVDYKIQRLLKYLKINMNINEIPNFRIEYNSHKIKYFDKNGQLTEYKCSREKEKVKKLI